jgi:hypothetical protein
VIIKYGLKRKYSTTLNRFDVLPTSGLFVWYLVNKKVKGSKFRIKFAKLNLFKKHGIDFEEQSYRMNENFEPPIDNVEKVKSYTWNLKEVRNYIKKFKYPLVEVTRSEGSGKGWVVFWYPLEIIMMNRTSALRVDLEQDGTYIAKRIFFKQCNLENSNIE